MCKVKCLESIPVKTTCYVLAIINAVANGSVFVWCCIVEFILLAFDGFSMKIGGVRFKRSVVDDVIDDYWIPINYLIHLCTVFSLLTVIFSALLCFGITQRRWKRVKAYFTYGCVITALAVLAAIVQVSTGHKSAPALWGLFGCGLHSLFLVLVHRTYVELVDDAMLNDHVRLNDIEDRDVV